MPGYLDTVGAQLAQLTARGVDRSAGPTLVRSPQRHGEVDEDGGPAPIQRTRFRVPGRGPVGSDPRRRREALVVVTALLVAVIVVAGLLALGLGADNGSPKHHATTAARTSLTHRHRRAARNTSTRPLSAKAPASAAAPRHVHAPAGPVPPGFGPESFTAIGTDTWWLLGSAPCAAPPCTSILRTDDGGHSFVGTPAPRTTRASQLRFANAADGFAFASQLWVTHNGGAEWHRLHLGGAVTDVASANGFAYALVRYGHRGAGRLERAPLGSDTWTILPGAGSAYAGLWAHGSDVLIQSGGGAELEVSHDAGVNFRRVSAPSSLPCDLQEPVTGIVWAHCATGTERATWRSTDSGVHFQPVSGPKPGLPNSALFAAASARTAVVGSSILLRTTDAGAHWTPVAGAGVTAWQYLGFTDTSHGVAVGYVGSPTPADERLYYTSDGGATYHLVPIG